MDFLNKYLSDGDTPDFKKYNELYSNVNIVAKHCSYIFSNGNYPQSLTFIMSNYFFWKNLNSDLIKSIFTYSMNNVIGIMNSSRFFGTYFDIIPITKIDLDKSNYDTILMMIKSKGGYYLPLEDLRTQFHEYNIDFNNYVKAKEEINSLDFIKIDKSPPEKLSF